MRRRLSSSAPAVPFSLRVFLSSPAFFSFSPSPFLPLSLARARVPTYLRRSPLHLPASRAIPLVVARYTPARVIHTNHRSARIHTTHTFRSSLPIGRPSGLAGRLRSRLSLRRFPIVSPRRIGARSLPLRCTLTLGRATRRPRCIPRGTSARHRLYRASLRPCVSPALPYFFLAAPPSSRPRRRPHAHIGSLDRFSLGRTLSLSPPSLAVPSFFPLFLLLSVVRRRGRRLPDRLALIPSARRRLLFFRLFVLASSRAGNRRRLRRLRWLPLSRLVNRDSPSKRVAKSTKAREFFAREARERA